MTVLDYGIAQPGGGIWTILVVALLLGLRHATDPDHLTAVSTLILSDSRHGVRRANLLGLSWGLGHAITLILFGLPVILFSRYIPSWLQQAAELMVGVTIMALAGRLLFRWSRGYFHAHPHTHGPLRHAHPHVHDKEKASPHPDGHVHPHAEGIGRSPLAALGIGMLHGLGGSAGAGVLLLATIQEKGSAILALLLFSGATAVSMAIVSSAFGLALVRGPFAARSRSLVPAFGVGSLLFGAWYSWSAFLW